MSMQGIIDFSALQKNLGMPSKGFFSETLPKIGQELSHRINDNFQELIHAN